MKEKIILLVEDNPDDVQLTMRAFKENNIFNELKILQDGVEALEYLLQAAVGDNDHLMPAVILLDLKLPRRDGLEVLVHIRSHDRLRKLPVIVLTSSREERDIRRCYDSGANSYIRKPVDFEEFTDVIRQIGSYWLKLNELPFRVDEGEQT